jgi:hypothetical protein
MKLAIVVLCALVSLPSFAADAPAAKPEDVARQMMTLTKQADWPAYAKLMHPDALKEFKRMFGEMMTSEGTKELGRMFFDTPDAAAYNAVAPDVLFVRFMTNLTKNVPQFAEALKSSEGKVIGGVAEGEDVMHVVYRGSAAAEGISVSRVNAITLRKHEGQWRVLLSGEIGGIADRLKQLANR